jgi:hypothetical protein
MSVATAFSYWAALPPKQFVSKPHFYGDEDFLTYFINENRCFAQRINELVTVFTDIRTGELVGCKVKGIQRILSNIKGFHVRVTDGTTTLGLLFLSLLAESPDREKPSLRRAAERFSDVPIPQQALSTALGA